MNPRYLEKPRLIELATYLPMNQYVEIIHKKGNKRNKQRWNFHSVNNNVKIYIIINDGLSKFIQKFNF